MNKKNTLSRLKEKERTTRQKIIIKAAREVFGKRTYDKVSMAEIARAAGIGKSSIYTYFKNQEDLYVEAAYQDSLAFILGLRKQIEKNDSGFIKATIEYFLEYYIVNEAQWRMITHFALHGNKDKASVERLNHIGRQLLDLFDSAFEKDGKKTDTRLLSHALFSSLSGILIAYRKYPGRTEEDRKIHMMRVGQVIEIMISNMA